MGRVPFHLERIRQSQFRSVNTKEKNCDCSVECFQLQKEKYTGARKGGRSESICRERSKQEFDNELSSRLYDAQIRLFIWKPGTITTCPPKSLPASSDPVQVFYTRLLKNFVHIKYFFKRVRRKVRATSCLRPSHLSWSTRVGHYSKTVAWISRHR